MANVKIISTLIADQLSLGNFVLMRGFTTTTQCSLFGIVKASGIAMVKRGGEESKKPTPWVPDPVSNRSLQTRGPNEPS
ncbi:putative Late embryogenesis abundant protein, LEA_3 subgroup [Helianthus annuus]|uniref:Late embryogenesis abundant protein, LEA_3 subgroup n=1 Tax=Helianthus annuus TaxID=4232 RepID=A0A251S4Q6_HELAN|nr:putative Late embryogenesis abundant protein, LEA_3 subgroup [Helianthus annuus]